jgi:type II secretory pathway predicted ATPase ExeA
MGKTSLIFQYLEGLRETARTVFLFHTEGDSRNLMNYILADLGLDASEKDLPEMHAMLNRVLLEEMRAGRRFVLVIDEAQNLREKVLESIRLLSNFETPWKKLMQIVLAGQPQLARRLEKPSMLQLRQRVSLSIHIEPLAGDQINAYVNHRLWVAGHRGAPIFSVGAQKLLAEASDGIPRNINNLCFCAMSLGWATSQKIVDREMIGEVLADLKSGEPHGQSGVSPESVELPKPPVLQIPRLRVRMGWESRALGWLGKGALTSVVLFALGWSVGQFRIGNRLADFWRDQATAAKPYSAPAPAALPAHSVAPADSDSHGQGQRGEISTHAKKPSAQAVHRDASVPAASSGGSSQ